MKLIFYELIISSAILAVSSSVFAYGITVGTKVGQAYPNYVLPSLADGKPLSIAQFRGKKIVLHQFASW